MSTRGRARGAGRASWRETHLARILGKAVSDLGVAMVCEGGDSASDVLACRKSTEPTPSEEGRMTARSHTPAVVPGSLPRMNEHVLAARVDVSLVRDIRVYEERPKSARRGERTVRRQRAGPGPLDGKQRGKKECGQRGATRQREARRLPCRVHGRGRRAHGRRDRLREQAARQRSGAVVSAVLSRRRPRSNGKANGARAGTQGTSGPRLCASRGEGSRALVRLASRSDKERQRKTTCPHEQERSHRTWV